MEREKEKNRREEKKKTVDTKSYGSRVAYLILFYSKLSYNVDGPNMFCMYNLSNQLNEIYSRSHI